MKWRQTSSRCKYYEGYFSRLFFVLMCKYTVLDIRADGGPLVWCIFFPSSEVGWDGEEKRSINPESWQIICAQLFFFFSVKGLLMCIVYRHFDIFKALSIIIIFHELWGP